MRPIAGMNEMGVAIHQARRDPTALAIHFLASIAQAYRHFAFRTGINDTLVQDCDGAAFNRPKPVPIRRKRGEARVAPEADARSLLLINIGAVHFAFLSTSLCIDITGNTASA